MNRSHTHCPGCGLHFRSVTQSIQVNADEGTWVCSTCVKQTNTARHGHQVLIPCPDCNHVRDSALPCSTCSGLGSVYVAQSAIRVYGQPGKRVLTEG